MKELKIEELFSIDGEVTGMIHTYTDGEVIEYGDTTGDSLGISRKNSHVD